ncbi:uncharacterized protein CLAFUR5_13161 [Fulvia fulva]|uniref:SnoaL-like domain-containing protein n=1 Tax=Passalora fulva TaxID=5499 RepID=A0A9Q8UV79_PASFU|nr:uncharacterized protein CLAFUR5_13161 [Fulvia fulva]KAK4613105.1 hypothetical protein CLAFUR0_13317 [Fulvia fulva]UJO23693.1 hypothetical protein CLAFUR5_13161 [Fulvia fulva]
MTSLPSPPDSVSTAEEQRVQKIGPELERLTKICIDAINQRDWDYTSPEGQDFLSHVHPSFTAIFDNVPGKMDWAGLNAAWQTMFAAHPEGQFNITRMNTAVDTRAGYGTVVIESEATGVSNVVLHGLSEAKWRRVNGKWLFYYHAGMRGSSGNSGFV